ncbi:TetR/AcrR family transcriptional regulator [Radiobacillus deserti]|uniref:TetR/AcrR family transcriptional regulator n=1 Tax=Radiobacillus deserti TaxID=2594883 RepID=A0A516KDN7_9BACI|nr:TetR/AcrR family transcriptional regulator [Radiobacillus deserti]QDP39511.1 TetR/AcrR family transcriptional regulator [Radiobacillus deserti]
MEKEQLDPRIIRTRQLLRNAFVELLKEMDIEKISVNRLTERATINRVTFYLHYKDIPDMLERMADDMITDISSSIENVEEAASTASKDMDRQIMVNFLEHIEKNKEFYKVILTSRRIPIFRDRLLQLITDKIMSRMETRGKDSFVSKVGIQPDILIWYDSSAIIGTIVAWLRNDLPYSPTYLANQFYLLHNRVVNEK